MKWLTFILGLSLQLHAAARMDIDGVEMYPDTKPQSKQVFVVDWSEGQRWKEEGADRRRYQIWDNVKNVLEKIGFVSLPQYGTFGENKISYVAGRFIAGKLKESFIIQCQYQEDSLEPTFEEFTCCADNRIKRTFKEKWNIRLSKDDNGEFVQENCIELSWKWVDFAIHYINMRASRFKDFTDPKQSIFCKRLYSTIKRKGLETTVRRIGVVVNRDLSCSFNAIYENDEQEKAGKEFQLKLQREL